MKKSILFLLFLLLNNCIYSQENDSLRVVVSHIVINPTLTNPSTTVETYINVNDSIDLFIDNMQKQFGQTDEDNGVFVWQGILIDSVGSNLEILMYHGVWTTKNDTYIFQTTSTQKIKNLKKNEKRGIRIRVFLKNGKDALTSKKNEIAIVTMLEGILNIPAEEVKEE
jgi:hypothetical protein